MAKLGVAARDIRPDPVGTEPLPVVGVLPAEGAGVEPRNTEPALCRCSDKLESLVADGPAFEAARSTDV